MKQFQPTPLGLWNRAKEFAEAANVVANAAGNQKSLPAYYLWGHSIELSLKAFLFSRGVPLRKLASRNFGHDLEALLEEAKRHNIKTVVVLTRSERLVIIALNYDYKAKHFEYCEAADYNLPFEALTKCVVEKLVFHLENVVKTSKKSP
jgi:HEPN domain-containing protein